MVNAVILKEPMSVETHRSSEVNISQSTLSVNLHRPYNRELATAIKHAQRYPSSGTFAHRSTIGSICARKNIRTENAGI